MVRKIWLAFIRHLIAVRLAAADRYRPHRQNTDLSPWTVPAVSRSEIFRLNGIYRYLCRKRLARADLIYYHSGADMDSVRSSLH